MKYLDKLAFPVVLFALMALASAVSIAAPVASTKSAKPAVANASSLQEIGYEALEGKVGKKLVINTTNDTTRSGELLRFTKISLTLKLGPDSGSIELAIPRETIRKILIEIAPADPLFLNEKSPQEGVSGAKKN